MPEEQRVREPVQLALDGFDPGPMRPVLEPEDPPPSPPDPKQPDLFL